VDPDPERQLGHSSRSDKTLVIDANTYVSPQGKLFRWADRDYTTIGDVRSKLGFESNGRVE
jgi:hypothetical protein